MMTRFYCALLVCATLFFLSACGQKGPLYMPAPEKTAPTEAS